MQCEQLLCPYHDGLPLVLGAYSVTWEDSMAVDSTQCELGRQHGCSTLRAHSMNWEGSVADQFWGCICLFSYASSFYVAELALQENNCISTSYKTVIKIHKTLTRFIAFTRQIAS